MLTCRDSLGSAARRAVGLAIVIVVLQAASARAACTISATSVAFGSYNVFDTAPLDSTGNVTFRCGKDKNITITLSRGGSGSFNRTMQSGIEHLSYNLYIDATRTSTWGDGTGGTVVYQNADPPNNTNVVLTVYGRVPAGQDVTIGSYGDTLVATILY